MDEFISAMNYICSGFVVVLMIVALITFRKQRMFKPLVLFISAIISLVMLVVYIPLSGIEVNPVLAGVFFFLGFVFGVVSGFSANLHLKDAAVLGRFSRISFILYCTSLIFSMLVNRSPSAVASALAVLPFCLTSGMQFSSNIILVFRSWWLKRKQAAPVQ
jgi:hypothetical protein